LGFDIVEAANGREAFDAFKARRPHLVWMDLRMPVMDGHEAARRIREEEANSGNESAEPVHTPVIAFTAHAMNGEIPPIGSSLFDGFVRKPVQASAIFHILENHLGVRFDYRKEALSGEGPVAAGMTGSLTPEALCTAPPEWLKQFQATLKKGHAAEVFDLVEQIRPENASLAQALAELVHIHRFDSLVSLTDQALEEYARG
jgi:CheY-like chemotaxis protein